MQAPLCRLSQPRVCFQVTVLSMTVEVRIRRGSVNFSSSQECEVVESGPMQRT